MGVLKEWMRVVWWSDCGPQLRSRTALAHSAYTLPLKFRIHVHNQFGLECHYKSLLDAFMGELPRRLMEAATVKGIAQISDIQNIYEQRFEQLKRRTLPRPMGQ